MKIVFMGTPDFAVHGLDGLYKDHEIAGVFTQPDKPAGRGYQVTPPPVKARALRLGIPVYQPASLKDGEALNILKKLNPNVIVVIAYGKILPREILTLPKYGCINVHASLLPKYRGASPIQWAIVSGEEKTGVTVMQMDEGLDTGDMLLKEETAIGPNETAGELHDRLSIMGAGLIVTALERVQNGTIKPEKQNHESASYAPVLTKETARINWLESAAEIHNSIRGFNPWPAAHTTVNGKLLKIYAAEIGGGSAGKPGEFTGGAEFTVCCGDGRALKIKEAQLEGKKRMHGEELLRGRPARAGTVLGG